MKRSTPVPALSWTDGEHPKRYASMRSAYYEIAKRMVIAKYPPSLGDGNGETLPDELVAIRAPKHEALFANADSHFDDRKWKRFVRRVAKFLAFVDSKRAPAEMILARFDGFLPSETAAMLQAEYERAERESAKLAEYAREVKRAIDALANR